MEGKQLFSVFTKPWRELTVSELGAKISGFGFDGIEFPLRAGYQLEPEQAERGLPVLAEQLKEYGLNIFSVASETSERVFAGCAAAGVPLIRIMTDIDPAEGYMASVERTRRKLESLLPLCEKYGVKVGVQQHYGNCVADSAGLLHLLAGLPPSCLGAVWDAAHDALAGQQPEFGLDIVWSQLAMVNLKNAYYYRTNGPEAGIAEWKRYFTTGPHGLASWPRIADYLKKRNYQGVVCLTAEYEAQHLVDSYIVRDLAYAQSLFAAADAGGFS
ncbi:sugar phosphate isomerase/epimerase family protein [Paenibacillus cymbidii]|uniref:sugar phosphate isomerase/epimerase family protein n=1 Tax=Paenibacillus cymbidii TaxID=1639034 RepID=UPI0014367424|nr:sugar phosphate isomerase/epimerase [Paenibacillus cymbidii]